jgi:hypothetical protein
MRERTDMELNILRLDWMNEAIEAAFRGEAAMSIRDYVIEHLDEDEMPEYNRGSGWSFDNCSITSDELIALCDRIKKPIREGVTDREKRIWNIRRLVKA